jgi:hypothetical protein
LWSKSRPSKKPAETTSKLSLASGCFLLRLLYYVPVSELPQIRINFNKLYFYEYIKPLLLNVSFIGVIHIIIPSLQKQLHCYQYRKISKWYWLILLHIIEKSEYAAISDSHTLQFHCVIQETEKHCYINTLHSHRRENLKSYTVQISLLLLMHATALSRRQIITFPVLHLALCWSQAKEYDDFHDTENI